MRVIGGQSRGKRLIGPKSLNVRPTADRVKETLFNILPRELDGYAVLDLFAGTGSLSIEAISRGAQSAVLVDAAAKSVVMIRENLKRLGYDNRARVMAMPAARALRQLSKQERSFDLIFVDPPYERAWIDKVMVFIGGSNLLKPSGWLVVEHSAREPIDECYGRLRCIDQRKFGDTRLSFYTTST